MASEVAKAKADPEVEKTCDTITPVEKLPLRTKDGLVMLRRLLMGTVQYSDRVLDMEGGKIDRVGLKALNAQMKTWLSEMETALRGQGMKV